jgi:hypothetical protein
VLPDRDHAFDLVDRRRNMAFVESEEVHGDPGAAHPLLQRVDPGSTETGRRSRAGSGEASRASSCGR